MQRGSPGSRFNSVIAGGKCTCCLAMICPRGNVCWELPSPNICKLLTEQSSIDLEKIHLSVTVQFQGRNPLNGCADDMGMGG